MVDTVLIIGITITALAVFAYLSRHSAPETSEKGHLVFQYPMYIRWLPLAVLVFLDVLVVWVSWYRYGNFLEEAMKGKWEWLGIHLAAVLGWLYLYFRKVIMTDEAIILRSAFGRTEIPFSHINKIVVHKSEGNPGAANTKLYTPKALGNKKIALDVLMQGYDQCVADVMVNAKNAEYIEK